MKRYILRSPLLVGILSLFLLFPWAKKDSLTDIAKPYLGVYECQQATVGSKDCLDKFSYIRLELNSDDTYTLSFETKKEKKKELTGNYSYDAEKEVITMSLGDKKTKTREFPLKDGEITISVPVHRKQLVLKFVQQ